MEMCKYDSRHHIENSDERSHCRECCRMICKREDDAEDGDDDDDNDHCMWDKLENELRAAGGSSHATVSPRQPCPARHTLMERHHLHDCVDYDTGKPKLGLKRLKSELGLDIKGGPGGGSSGGSSSGSSSSGSNSSNSSSSNSSSSLNGDNAPPPPAAAAAAAAAAAVTTPPTTSTSSQALHLSPCSQGVQAQQVRTTLHTIPLPGDSITVFQTTQEARRYTYATVEVLRERFLRGRHEHDRDDRHRGRGGGGGGGRGNVRGGGDQGRDRVRYDGARDRSILYYTRLD